MSVTIQVRRDTAANWTTANSILASGEQGLEQDTLKFKWGDGVTAWNSLAYAFSTGAAQIWSGTSTVNFGSTPTDEASVVVTGLANMTTAAHIQVWIQGDDSTSSNTAADHDALSYFARCSVAARVAGVGFTIYVRNWAGQAQGSYLVHWQYTLANNTSYNSTYNGTSALTNTVTTNYTATTNDYSIVANGTSAFTITLPASSGSGQVIELTNINVGVVTLDGAGSDLVGGSLTVTLNQGDSITIRDYSAGNWIII